jgi:hypothetical protein
MTQYNVFGGMHTTWMFPLIGSKTIHSRADQKDGGVETPVDSRCGLVSMIPINSGGFFM